LLVAGLFNGKGKTSIFRHITVLMANKVSFRATVDAWHGKVSDDQFYKKGITILEGIRKAAPKGIEIQYTPGFDIDGKDENMAAVLDIAKEFDAFIVCLGEHVYSECKCYAAICSKEYKLTI
jgi:hypothetical protein